MTNSASASTPFFDTDQAIDFTALSHDLALWFQHHWLRIIIAVAVAVAVATILASLRRFGVALCSRDRPGGDGWWRVIGRTIAATGYSFIGIASVHFAAHIADPPIMVEQAITFLFTIAAVLQAAFWARALILGGVQLHTSVSDHSAEVISSAMSIIRLMVTFIVFAIALIVVLDNLGVNVTGLVAGLGVGGIAIGLAAQGIFADLFAALAIIFGRPFKVGDVISFDNTSGTVEEIGLKSTRLRPPSGELHIIANRNLLDKEIQNISNRQHRRIKFAIGVIYQTPVDVVRDLPDRLQRIVEREGYQFAQSGFVNFGASSLDFELEFDSPSPTFADFYAARHKVGLAILADFTAAGIEFAYPTQTSFTAAPDGTIIMPYAEVQAVKRVDLKDGER